MSSLLLQKNLKIKINKHHWKHSADAGSHDLHSQDVQQWEGLWRIICPAGLLFVLLSFCFQTCLEMFTGAKGPAFLRSIPTYLCTGLLTESISSSAVVSMGQIQGDTEGQRVHAPGSSPPPMANRTWWLNSSTSPSLVTSVTIFSLHWRPESQWGWAPVALTAHMLGYMPFTGWLHSSFPYPLIGVFLGSSPK